MPQAMTDWAGRHPRLWGVLWAVGAVLSANLIALILAEALGYVRVSMIFLAGVLVVAVAAGAWAAYLASALGFVSYNFYLVEPRFTFGIESEDIVILVVFFTVAMMTGSLAGRLRDAGVQVEAQARTTTLLFETSRDLAALEDEGAILQRLAVALSEAAGAPAMVSSGDLLARHPEGGLSDALEDLPPPAPGEERLHGPWRVRGLWAEGRPLGVAAWASGPRQDSPPDQARRLDVLLDMGASAVARAQHSRGWAEMQARARTESLRNALLSSISHDLRTPLASILASATSLKAFGGAFDPEVRDDLLDTIEEEAERLNRFVGNLLNMTRLEAGALTLAPAAFELRESLGRLVEAYGRRPGGGALSLQIEGDMLVAQGDVILFEQAMGNILENALKFSPDGAPIRVSARPVAEGLMVEVADQGPGVPEADLERIFEKFYRSGGEEDRQGGAGLGLSIVRGLLEAMGGTAVARNRKEGGLVLSVCLPGAAA